MSHEILAAVDFSSITDQVLDEAVRLAKAMHLPLQLLHVAAVKPEPGFDEFAETHHDLTETWMGRLRKQLEGYRKKAGAEGLEATATVFSGIPVEVILREVNRLEATFLVLGSRGHGKLHYLLAGSVCQSMLRRATCPVVVIPEKKASVRRTHEDTDESDEEVRMPDWDSHSDPYMMWYSECGARGHLARSIGEA